MTKDTIEREIFIRAGIDHVWSLVSKAGFWVGEELTFAFTAKQGETVVVETERYGTFPVRVETLEPPRFAAYSWASSFPGAELAEGNATRVEFTLVEQNDGTLVKVRESGFASLEADEATRTSNYDSNLDGWGAQLELLRVAAEGPVRS